MDSVIYLTVSICLSYIKINVQIKINLLQRSHNCVMRFQNSRNVCEHLTQNILFVSSVLQFGKHNFEDHKYVVYWIISIVICWTNKLQFNMKKCDIEQNSISSGLRVTCWKSSLPNAFYEA